VKIAGEQEPAARKTRPTPQDCPYACDAHVGCNSNQNIALASVACSQ